MPVGTKLTAHALSKAAVSQESQIGGHEKADAAEREDEGLNDGNHA